ncbi:hypothetical protein OV207_00720 [Corallococcus sp. BB11-1]|uniref:hypothetical protein n=1 Tax=Corallococcus sp. BB11-1 TaxID=2996783 RepID=UPI00226F56A1|nr:hypothetical protein [Corallococcus sp. BB11-1]MCY1029966.1 hypothetical protein [Corallococcus sp. BB11-1]
MRLRSPGFPLLSLLILFGGGPARGEDTQAGVPAFKFAWPVPSRVGITERVVSEREHATLKYDGVLTARKPGPGATLHFENLQQVEPAARKNPPGTAGTEDLKALLITFTKPDLLLSETGALTRIEGLEPALGSAVTVLEPDPQERESHRARWDTPLFQNQVRDRAELTWAAWVGTWSGVRLASGEERTKAVRLRHPNGPLEQRSTLRHRGAVAGTSGAVRLEWEMSLDGAPYRQVVARTRELRCSAALARNPSDPCAAEVLESASSVTTVELVTEPGTLRPFSARTVHTETFTLKGKPPVIQREERSYAFDWNRKAKRPGAR